MSGFFKKLFNRITGKTDAAPAPEAAPPIAEAPVSAPAPAPAPEVVSPPDSAVTHEPAAEAPVTHQTKARKPALPVAEPKPLATGPAAKPVAKKAAAAKPATKSAAPKSGAAKATALKPKPAPEPKKVAGAKGAAKAEAKPVASAKGKAPAKVAPPAAKSKAAGKAAPAPVVTRKAAAPRPVVVEAPKPVPVPPAPVKPVVVEVPAPKPAPPPPVVVAPPPSPPAPAPERQAAPAPVKPAVPAPAAAQESAAPERRGWLSRLTQGLSKSSKSITSSITSIFTKRKLDGATLEELEDVLIQADLGVTVSERIIKAVSAGRYDKEIEPEEVKRILAAEIEKVLKPVEVPFNFGSEKPYVILVVGVNGAGKTTTIGKLGAIASNEGFKVMFAACDTFRAAAIEQLTVWGQRVGAVTVSRPTGSDSSGLAYDAMQSARADGTDILFIDTAGRLQNKAYLMDELDKIVRVIKKQDDSAPHAVLLVLDATTGQNALAQADIFTKVAGVTGLIMTKLDGTARGGILVAIAERFKIPIHAIGVGETIDDLQPFDAQAFSRAISGLESL
jgi:fused signal recognition particle receptor